MIDLFIGLKFALNVSASIEVSAGVKVDIGKPMSLDEAKLAIALRTGIGIEKAMLKIHPP